MADVAPFVTTIPVNVHLPARDAADAELMAGIIGAWIEAQLAEHEEKNVKLGNGRGDWPWPYGGGTRFFVTSINVGEPTDTEEDDDAIEDGVESMSGGRTLTRAETDEERCRYDSDQTGGEEECQFCGETFPQAQMTVDPFHADDVFGGDICAGLWTCSAPTCQEARRVQEQDERTDRLRGDGMTTTHDVERKD